MHLDESAGADMDRIAQRHHLKLYRDSAQVLDCPRGADTAVADGCSGLAHPLRISLIESVFQRAGDRMVIFGHDKDVAIEFIDLRLPLLRSGILGRDV